MGIAQHKCGHCGARFFYNERLNKKLPTTDPKFSLCCKGGQVTLPLLNKPPSPLLELLDSNHPKHKHFMENIRAYNIVFAFTSMGGKTNSNLNKGKGPYVYNLAGRNDHRIGTLLPDEGCPPQFAQLYIYDTDNEVENRMRALR